MDYEQDNSFAPGNTGRSEGRRPHILYLVSLLVIFGLATLPPVRAQVLRVTLKDMVRSASTIVTGQVVEVREGRHPDYRNVGVTYVTVEVEEMLKGAANRRTRHVFVQFGGVGLTRMAELPNYRVGEDVVLFLYPESEYGFTSPVGGGQGKLYLRPDPQTGQRTVSQGLADTKFYEGIDLKPLSPAERTAISDRSQSVSYRTFASLVRKLAKN